MEINQRFEHYTITEIIGEGGMGLVGKAVDAEGHVVAIKQLKEHILGHHEALARFEREQRVQSVLQHPNIVPLIDAGEVGGIPYFVMPFVEGESLSQRLRRGALNYKQAQAVIRDIGSALTFAHQNNILHRDIKPGNIMLHPEGRAYLTDFGIATDPDVNPSLQTRTIHLSGMGTPDYMAPEVLRGQRSTQLSEIYSFGVTIYEMLTGQRYVNALHQNENPWEGLPLQLAQVLQRATHVSLPARYPHISAFTDDCLRILTTLANQPKPKQKPRPAQQNAPTPQFFTASPRYTDTTPQPEAPSYRMVFTIGMVMVLVATIVFFMLAMLPAASPANLTQTSDSATRAITVTARAIQTQQFIQTVEAVIANPTALAMAQASDFIFAGAKLYAMRDTQLLFSVDSPSGEAIPRGTLVTVGNHPGDNVHTYSFRGQNYYYVQPQYTGGGWVLGSDFIVIPNLSQPQTATAVAFFANQTASAWTETPTLTVSPTLLAPIRQTETAVASTGQYIQTATAFIANQTATTVAQAQIADFNQAAIPVGTVLYTQRDTQVLFSVDSSLGEGLPRGFAVTVENHPSVGVQTYFYNGQGYYYVQPQNTGAGWVLASDLGRSNPFAGQAQQPGQSSDNVPANTGFQIGQVLYIDAHTSPSAIVYLQWSPQFSNFENPITHGTQVSIIGEAQFQILDTSGVGQWWWLVRDSSGQEGYIEEGYLVMSPPPPIVLTPTATSRSDLAAWGSGTELIPLVTVSNFMTDTFPITVRDAVTLTGFYRYDAEFNDYSWQAITQNGTLGWVRQSQWQATIINDYPPLEPWGQGTALTNPNPANLRINPDNNALIVVQIITGSRLVASGNFHFDEVSDQWWWLVTANRTTGWIPQSELREP